VKRKNVSWALGLGLVVSAGACGGFGSAPSDPTSDAGADSAPPPSISADPRLFLKVLPVAPQKLVVGSKLTFQVRIERNGFEGDVELTVRNAPKDVSVVSAKLRTESEGTLELSAPETAQTQPVKVDLVAITSLGNVQVSFDLDIRGAFGTVDKSFGGGVVYLKSPTEVPGTEVGVENGLAMPDGNVVIVGSRHSFLVNPSGGVTSSFFKDPQRQTTEVVALKNGGVQTVGSTDTGVALIRSLPDGTLDQGWGAQGLVPIPSIDGEIGAVRAIATEDGAAYVARLVANRTTSTVQVCVHRFRPDGAQDSMFQGAGVWCSPTVSYSTEYNYGGASIAYFLPRSGAIELAWSLGVNGTMPRREGKIVRLRLDGTLDPALSSNRNLQVPYFDIGQGVAVSSLDELYLCGHDRQAPGTLFVTKLDAARIPDPLFSVPAGSVARGTVGFPGKSESAIVPGGAFLDGQGNFYAPYAAQGRMGFYRINKFAVVEPDRPIFVNIPEAIPDLPMHISETRALLPAPNDRLYVIASGKRAAIARIWL
jgi:hypothetical protein